MLEAIHQNPLVTIILILAAVIPAVWATLNVLYVKPRDFRISTLEKNVDELRNELLNKRSTTSPVQSASARETVPTLAPITQSPPASPSVAPDPLRSLGEMYRAWRREDQTELQRKNFEERYTGQHVTWNVTVDSIDKTKYRISVYADDNAGDVRTDYRVCADFPLTEESRLLEFKPGEYVRLSGQISRFFIYPNLEPAKIDKLHLAPNS